MPTMTPKITAFQRAVELEEKPKTQGEIISQMAAITLTQLGIRPPKIFLDLSFLARAKADYLYCIIYLLSQFT